MKKVSYAAITIETTFTVLRLQQKYEKKQNDALLLRGSHPHIAI